MKNQLLELIGNELFVFSLHSEGDVIFESVRDIDIKGNYQKVLLTFRYKEVDFYGHMSLLDIIDTFEIQEVSTTAPSKMDEVLFSNY